MPTNRKRIKRHRNEKDGLCLPLALKYFFETGDENQDLFPEDERFNEFLTFGGGVPPHLADFWAVFGEQITREFKKKHNGRLPWAATQFDTKWGK